MEVEQVKQFKYLCSTLAEDTKYTREIRLRITMAIGGFQSKKNLFTGNLNL